MRLFLGNLPYAADAQDLQDWFLTCGFRARDVKVLLDRDTGRSRGFGFCEVDDVTALEQMNNQELMGRKVHVKEAEQRQDRPRETRTQDHRHGRQD